MSTVSILEEVFARLIGRRGDVLLFEVSPQMVVEGWSQPVQFRFVRTEGGLLSLEMRQADPFAGMETIAGP
jgi:hypothetical protein